MNIRSLTAPLALAAALTSGMAFEARATVVVPLTIEAMTARADVVCVGVVLSQRAAWNVERTRIYTTTEVRVERTLKGKRALGDVLTVRQLGGVVDGISQVVPGNARLTPGETAVLFLDADEALPFHYVVGMAQGKFTVQPAPDGARVTQDVHDLAFMAAPGATPTDTPPAQSPARLDALEQAVRRATQP
jgi:hypothetical protein